jgi:hypothetical protein
MAGYQGQGLCASLRGSYCFLALVDDEAQANSRQAQLKLLIEIAGLQGLKHQGLHNLKFTLYRTEKLTEKLTLMLKRSCADGAPIGALI